MAFPIAARFAHPDAGYAGDQNLAAQHLTVGKVYTVRLLEVGRSSSTLYLDAPGLREIGFDTVMFEPASVYDDDGETGEDAGQDGDDEGIATAGALADFLASQPRDRKVVLRKDAEGNGHSPLADAWEAIYEPDSTYSGEVYPTPENIAAMVATGEWTEADEDDRYEPGDGAERVIVLGPVN